mgnify:CR=1 FL=1
MAALPPGKQDWANVMRLADKALYTAKQAGRTFAELMGEKAALTEQEMDVLHERGELAVNVACRTQDGRLLQVERRLTVVDDEDGKPPSVLSVNREIRAP